MKTIGARLVTALSGVALAGALAGVTPAAAATLAGVTLPDEATVGGKTLLLNGLGLREATFLKVDVYVAGLYLESRSADAAAILVSPGSKRLVMQFVRDVKRDELVKAWQHGFDANAGAALPAMKDRIDRFNGWMTDMKVGETMSYTWTGGDAVGGDVAGDGVAVEIKGRAVGTIEGEDFGRALLAIWLGDSPPNPELKAGLLGKH
jgi:hypothetical protein